jgi:diaminopimelate decarboxylase
MNDLFPSTARVSADGHLIVGDRDVVELATRYGTPLIVLDRETIEASARDYTDSLPAHRVFYAGKAFCCIAICELMSEMGLGLDVCSGGELETALAAHFPPERIIFHGNNKSASELRLAQDSGVGRIVADSFDELDRIAELNLRVKILLRVTPGVEAHTHEYVQTGQEDSKFGFGLAGGAAELAVDRALALEGCELVGIHAHIGSQIFEVEPFEVAVAKLAEFCAGIKERKDFEVGELNVGGGLGVAHNQGEDPPAAREVVGRIVGTVESAFQARGMKTPLVSMEPGRSLIGRAGVTVYEVGTIKDIPGVRTYVSVDGGMSDNPRHALYDARYEAFAPARMNAPAEREVTIAGKHCESGDILIDEAVVPADLAPGDLLCLPATGAYTYSMASNYNRVPRPAVVMVADGHVTEIISRETSADLLRLDRRLDGSTPD